MTTKTRTPSPQALHRNRFLLIAGIVTVLPAAAIAPSVLLSGQSPGPLLAVEEMLSASVNERAVDTAVRQGKAPGEARVMTSASTPESQPPGEPMRTFNGRPIRPVHTIAMTVTAYSPDEQSCGDSADGITASGYSVWTNGMKMVAADTALLPFGTLVSVPGYDDAAVVPVLDRGGAIKGHRLDVLYPTHERAMEWGVQELEVTVWEYADGLPGDFQIVSR